MQQLGNNSHLVQMQKLFALHAANRTVTVLNVTVDKGCTSNSTFMQIQDLQNILALIFYPTTHTQGKVPYLFSASLSLRWSPFTTTDDR